MPTSAVSGPKKKGMVRSIRPLATFFPLMKIETRTSPTKDPSSVTNSTSTSSGGGDESLEDSANLSDPDVIAAEIVEDLESALQQFATIAAGLKR
jgi:hypothetical protein